MSDDRYGAKRHKREELAVKEAYGSEQPRRSRPLRPSAAAWLRPTERAAATKPPSASSAAAWQIPTERAAATKPPSASSAATAACSEATTSDKGWRRKTKEDKKRRPKWPPFCDSAGIQTPNLLIRSQMLYSIELRNQFIKPVLLFRVLLGGYGLLANASLLSGQIAEIEYAGATNLADLVNGNAVDCRRMKGENPFHTDSA